MEKATAAELAGAIGKVEEVETDAAGECIGKFLRMRISMDITKPLKNIVVLEQVQEQEEGEDSTKEKKSQCFCITKGSLIFVSAVGVLVVNTGSVFITSLSQKIN